MGCGSSHSDVHMDLEAMPRHRWPNSDLDSELEMSISSWTVDSDSPPPKQVEITPETLEKYFEIEKEIQSYEKRHVMENYQVKTEQLERLEHKVAQLEEHEKHLEEHAMVLQAVVDADNDNDQSVKQFLMEKTESDQELTAEQEAFVDTLNRQEINKTELISTTKQRDVLKKDVETLATEGDKLNCLYEERDKFLDGVFGGEYGSELEYNLEKELDKLKEQKQQVDQAYFKWRQSNVMAKQATSQLGMGVQKWKDLPEMAVSDLEQRYICAAEARNNFLAASQNLEGAQRYLPDLEFPYCNKEEVETLNQAITYIFTDMQTQERHEHAMACYYATYRRAAALCQWFDQVLNSTISRDLSQLTDLCNTKGALLRRERIRLIRIKVREMTGKDVEYNIDTENEIDDTPMNEDRVQLFQAAKVSGQNENLAPTPEMAPLPTPVPLCDLAPPPSNEQIFGKIDELRKRHREEVEDFKKGQAMNFARMEMGLKEKLKERRNRRNLRETQTRMLEALQTSE
ncbi:uncharacterized protein LOC143249778 [Tachypleus tridentatus]|uniref:uncharacterized protein LOC143249778 n=1 Tax=Tachypleus tridentatus TaxID=6853 RepID=UPI003FCFBFB4